MPMTGMSEKAARSVPMAALVAVLQAMITRYELLDGALRSEGYAAPQVLSLV